jgi:hypothetical protein
VNAGERARIVVGDSWVAGFDTEVSGQNDGTKDADVLIHANTKDWGAFSPPSSFPAATPSGNHADDSDLSLQFDGPVTFDLQRVTLGQDEELNVVVSDTETLLLVTDAGNMVRITRDGASAGISTTASALHTYPEGAYTISGGYTMSPDSNGTTTVYIARMRNAAAGAQNVASTPTAESASPEATPVASAVRPESIVTLEIDPTELGIGSPDTWDRMEFALVTVKVGEGFTTDHPYFTCCDGIAIFHIQQGSASFEVDGPVDLYTAGAEQGPARIASGTLIDLEPGDSVVLAKYALAIVANTGSAELLMLAGYGDEYSLEPVWAKPIEGYNDWPWITGSNLDQIAVNVVDVSFEQVTLEPGGLTYIDSNPEEWLAGWFPERSSTTVRMMRGTHSAISENPLDSFVVQTFVMDNFSSGPYTFFNAGNSTATLYLMRIVPVESPPPASSPVAEATLSGVLQMTTGP